MTVPETIQLALLLFEQGRTTEEETLAHLKALGLDEADAWEQIGIAQGESDVDVPGD